MTDAGAAAPIEPMLNLDGTCFVGLADLAEQLAALDNDGRKAFRNANGAAIATCEAERMLIVAGPGSGKSFLFRERIAYWLPLHPAQQVYVSTFVRKLVSDLKDAVKELSEKDQKRVQVSTLHTLARSIVERGHGTAAQPMRRNIRIIGRPWDEVTWDDVLAFHHDLGAFTVKQLEGQYHTGQMEPSAEWVDLEATYRRLCAFYNALGFAYMIRLASDAVAENPTLVEHQLWIIDEYQDFNASEDLLIRSVTDGARGLLMAGDDDQALYQTLKASTPDIIVGHYQDDGMAKAMLPFCARCGYHICRAASAFIAKHRAETSVEKIYLPLVADTKAPKVRVVVTHGATGAVDYVRRFLETRHAEYETYLEDRLAGKTSDPFLLILTPYGLPTFKGKAAADADDQLVELVNNYAMAEVDPSGDYLRVATYFSAGDLDDNLAVRKVLHFENVSVPDVNQFIREAMERNCVLSTVVLEQRHEIVGRIRDVAAIVTTGANDPHGAAADLGGVLDLQDPESLGYELGANPIGKDVAEREDEEAIQTADAALPPVALMGMTRSKGLSAHHVIVLGCDNVNMVKITALTFFVALTRARKTLHLVTSLRAGGDDAHPFIYDLPAEDCSYWSYLKGTRQRTALAGKQGFERQLTSWRPR